MCLTLEVIEQGLRTDPRAGPTLERATGRLFLSGQSKRGTGFIARCHLEGAWTAKGHHGAEADGAEGTKPRADGPSRLDGDRESGASRFP